MLELAYANQSELNKKFQEIAFVEKYKYYQFRQYLTYDLELAKDSWGELDFVSKKDGVIIGYLGASINRNANFVSSLHAINFYDKNIEFSRDFHKFITDLFLKFNFNKINFSIVVGNPADKMYGKYISKYGGTVAGYYKEDAKLWDGKIYDSKTYEIMRSEFVKHFKESTNGNISEVVGQRK